MHESLKKLLTPVAVAVAVSLLALVDDQDGSEHLVTIRATQIGAFDSAICLSNVTEGRCFGLTRGTTDTFRFPAGENEIVSITVTADGGGGSSFLAVENTGGDVKKIAIQGNKANPRISAS